MGQNRGHWLVVEPTPLKNIRQIGIIFPKVRVEKKMFETTTQRFGSDDFPFSSDSI